MFPSQFELKLSWNATVGNQRSVNNTNYVQGHIKIDQKTNRMMIQSNFSTLSLAPQELVSYILDFDKKHIYLKQRKSCKYYDILTQFNDTNAEKSSNASVKWDIDELPNIQELFDLFPYVMFFKGTTELSDKEMREFKYSSPLSQPEQASRDSELLAYFHKDTMALDRLIVRAHSLNITSPFTLYASQPVTEAKFSPADMDFQGVDCTLATSGEQEKLNFYVKSVYDFFKRTK